MVKSTSCIFGTNEFSANMSKDHAVAMATAKFSEGVRRVVAVESTQTDQAWATVLGDSLQ